MPDVDDLFWDRLRRMSVTVWLCTIGGIVLGVVAGVAILSSSSEVRAAGRLILGGLICLGFIVGLAVGCLLDMVLKSRRERQEKGKRPRRRFEREP
ncbi:MAG: hypothetical protein L0Z62_25495 [Gemmataceae bacterium]|nr:hypothetical protein [Gemmataceae bacterium]